VTHAYNSSYSGGRDWSLEVPSQPGEIVHKTLSQKNPLQKIGLVEWLKVKALSSNPSTGKKKKVGPKQFKLSKMIIFLFMPQLQTETTIPTSPGHVS
jgi:hypothetical protein